MLHNIKWNLDDYPFPEHNNYLINNFYWSIHLFILEEREVKVWTKW